MKRSLIGKYLESLAPLTLAESWDPVGWLVGDPQAASERVMTCLTVTPSTVEEAIAERADLIITHHPIPFRPVQRLTTETYSSNLLWRLARAGIAVYSLHTAWDSASQGINQQLAQAAGLSDIKPLVARPDLSPGMGSGRVGVLDTTASMAQIWRRLRPLVQQTECQYVGNWDRPLRRVAVGCGSGGSFLEAARQANCDLLITGEATFHTSLEAEGCGVQLLLLGHYGSERFAMDSLCHLLQRAFPDLQVWPSQRETDPVRWRVERGASADETRPDGDNTTGHDTDLN